MGEHDQQAGAKALHRSSLVYFAKMLPLASAIERRMIAQRLWGAPLGSAEDVVRSLTAMQAQEFQYAKWSVAQRSGHLTDADISRAYSEGVILRTHVLRPTWHFVLPEDLRSLLVATARHVRARLATYDARLELDDKTIATCNDILAASLEGGRHMTRDELAKILERKRIRASGQRLAHLLMHAELSAVVCSGAPKAKKHTYASFNERTPRSKDDIDEAEAVAELARRFFVARGPATIRDFTRWASLPAAIAKRALDASRRDLIHERIEDRDYFGGQPARSSKPSYRIDLVQGYDECLTSYTDSRWIQHSPVMAKRPPFIHAILLDGALLGHWRHAVTKRSAVIETSFSRKLRGPERQALEAAVARYGEFLGAAITMA